MNDPKIEYVIATHSKLAIGLLSTIEFIAGKQKNITCFTAYVDHCLDFENKIDDYISNSKADHIIITTDIFGGSVNNHLLELTKSDARIHLICGVNLPLILSLIVNVKGKEIDNEIKISVSEAQKGIIYCNALDNQSGSNELDEF